VPSCNSEVNGIYGNDWICDFNDLILWPAIDSSGFWPAVSSTQKDGLTVKFNDLVPKVLEHVRQQLSETSASFCCEKCMQWLEPLLACSL
jgi:hypothetical protein